MRVPEFSQIAQQATAAGTIALTTFEGQALTLRASDIYGVQALPSLPRSTVFTGNRALVMIGGREIVVRDTAANINSTIDAAISSYPTNYVQYEDQKAQNTAGGTFTSDDWRTRTINTEVYDADSLASVSSNQVTLTSGIWLIEASAPASTVNRHQVRLQDMTGGGSGTTIAVGTSTYALSTVGASNVRSEVYAKVSSSNSIIVELQHWCQTTKATSGFGLEANIDTEVYAVFKAWKIGDV